MIVKSLAFVLAVAAAETINGIVRMQFLNRRLGARRAKQVSLLTGLALCLLLCRALLPWIGIGTEREALVLGSSLAAFMVTFDIALGRLVFRMPWRTVAADFDLRKGNLLALGVLLMAFCPWLAFHLGRP